MHTQATQPTTHTVFRLKGWHAPTLLSHFPSLALCQNPAFPSLRAQFDLLLLGPEGRHTGLQSGGPLRNSEL